MLGQVVDHLHGARVPFHLASYPNEEAQPLAAYRPPPGGVLVDTGLFVADGRTVLVAFPSGESVAIASVAAALGTDSVVDATRDELPGEFRNAHGPLPPLGQLLGIPLVLDEQIARAAVIVFRAFSGGDYFEMPYESFGRLEQPRIARLASAGALGAAPSAPERR